MPSLFTQSYKINLDIASDLLYTVTAMSFPTLLTSILALALASIVNASPIQRREDSFSIQSVQDATELKNGPADMVKALQKFGQDVPEHIQVAADNRAATAGSVPANPTDQYDSLMYVR